MPQGNVVLCGVVVVEELPVVLAVGSTLEGFPDRSGNQSGGIATTRY